MKKNKYLIGAITALSAAAFVVYCIRKANERQRRTRVAEEGYETAYDILYPNKGRNYQKLTYGPILPE